jgi:hypothetical protein
VICRTFCKKKTSLCAVKYIVITEPFTTYSSVGATVHSEPWSLPRFLSTGPDPVSFVSDF